MSFFYSYSVINNIDTVEEGEEIMSSGRYEYEEALTRTSIRTETLCSSGISSLS